MENAKKSPDFLLFLITIFLIGIGIVMVFSSSAYTSAQDLGDPYYYVKRQMLWALIGFFLLWLASTINLKYVNKMANIIFLISLMLLIFVLVTGAQNGGASRWVDIGYFSFQPSELMKLSMVIFLARSLSRNSYNSNKFMGGIMPYLLLIAIICALVLAQPDLGTAVAIAVTAYFLFAVAGVKLRYLFVLAACGLSAVIVAVMSAPYRLERFITFLNPYADPIGTGYQTIQSLLALGSGGISGMGLAKGLQKTYYIPEKHTDFIYAVLGEELGFIGAGLVLALFFCFAWRGFKVATSADDSFKSLLAAGITIMISVQALINIGVVTGSIPVTGITLPFISYGGSSLILSMTGVGLLLNVSKYSLNKQTRYE